MTLDKIVTLNEIIELVGDIPVEGVLNVLARAVNKARDGKLSLIVDDPQPSIETLYVRFHPTEEVERTFAYLFAAADQFERAEISYTKLIDFLEQRGAYGMAADAAMEAHQRLKESSKVSFVARAQALYETQIKKMDREPAGERNEAYYDEMLLKAGRLDAYRSRTEARVKHYLKRGFFGNAATILDTLNRKEEAQRYKKLDELLKV